MSKADRNTHFLPTNDALFAAKRRKVVPHAFVLDAIAELSPGTRPMFGCLGVYVDDKIVFILRDKHDKAADNKLGPLAPSFRLTACGSPELHAMQQRVPTRSWTVRSGGPPSHPLQALRAAAISAHVDHAPGGRKLRTQHMQGNKQKDRRDSRDDGKPAR